MAKFYSAPAEVGPPPPVSLMRDYNAYLKAEQVWIDKVSDYAKARFPADKLAGKVWHYPVADGSAMYVILRSSPLTLIHLPVGDAWHIDQITARGLRLSDVKKQFEFDEAATAGKSK